MLTCDIPGPPLVVQGCDFGLGVAFSKFRLICSTYPGFMHTLYPRNPRRPRSLRSFSGYGLHTFFLEIEDILPQEERSLGWECRKHLWISTNFGSRCKSLESAPLRAGPRMHCRLAPPHFPEGEGGDGPGLTEPRTGSGASEEWVI